MMAFHRQSTFWGLYRTNSKGLWMKSKALYLFLNTGKTITKLHFIE